MIMEAVSMHPRHCKVGCIYMQAVVDDREREELFTEFMKERDRKEREEKKKERRRRMTAFKDLLDQTSGIKVCEWHEQLQLIRHLAGGKPACHLEACQIRYELYHPS